VKAAARSLAAAILTAGAVGCARRPAPAPRPVVPADSYAIRLGRATYVHYCEACHGSAGAGDGQNSYNLDPHPRDLAAPSFQKSKTDAELADAVRRGGAGVGLSPLMPPWGKTLSAEEVTDLVAYIRRLRRTQP
jgi:mono/diheme cytochrome c family protein